MESLPLNYLWPDFKVTMLHHLTVHVTAFWVLSNQLTLTTLPAIMWPWHFGKFDAFIFGVFLQKQQHPLGFLSGIYCLFPEKQWCSCRDPPPPPPAHVPSPDAHGMTLVIITQGLCFLSRQPQRDDNSPEPESLPGLPYLYLLTYCSYINLFPNLDLTTVPKMWE